MSFRSFYNTNKLQMTALLVLELITSGLTVSTTYTTAYIFTYIKQRSLKYFIIVVIIEISQLVFSYLGMNLCQYLIERQVQQCNHKIRKDIVKSAFYDQKIHTSSSIQNRLVTDLNIVKETSLLIYADIPYYFTQIVFAILILAIFHWSLLITVLIFGTLNILLPQLLTGYMQRSVNNLSKANKQYITTINNWLNGIDEIKSFFAKSKLFSVMSNSAIIVEKANIKKTKSVQILKIFNALIAAILQFILLVVTAFLVTNHVIAFGVILTVSQLNNFLIVGVKMLSTDIGQISSTKDLRLKIQQHSIINKNPKNKKIVPTSLMTQNLAIKFDNDIDIKYPNLNINSGNKVILLGSSGSGKSTLFKILLNQIHSFSGTVEFKNLAGTKINTHQVKLEYVPQDPVLFPGTIKENITMFNPVSATVINKVVETVYLKKDIDKMSEGLDTQINLNKLNISGGQRQKIVLARNLIKNKQFILIDEGTSAIDHKTNIKIIKNLLISSNTILFIAHNLDSATLKMFDKIINIK